MHNQADLQKLRAFETRQDVERYTDVLQKVLSLFGEGMHESITRKMGAYLEATGGRLSNANKSEWEKEIASRMIGTKGQTTRRKVHLRLYAPSCTSTLGTSLPPLPAGAHTCTTTKADPNPLHYFSQSLKLRTVATLSSAIVNGTHRPSHKVGKTMAAAG
jgi:hypothetical protein